MGRGDGRAAKSGRAAPGSRAAAGQSEGSRGGDADACSPTHLPHVRPAARSTDAARALPLLRDTALAAAGAPEPESREWSRSGQSGLRTRAQGGVHRGHRGPGEAAPCSPSSPVPTNAPREQHRANLGPLFPGEARSSPQQRPGFRRQHSAPSLLGLRHLAGGGKNTVRMRISGLPASPVLRRGDWNTQPWLAATLWPCGPASSSCRVSYRYL